MTTMLKYAYREDLEVALAKINSLEMDNDSLRRRSKLYSTAIKTLRNTNNVGTNKDSLATDHNVKTSWG